MRKYWQCLENFPAIDWVFMGDLSRDEETKIAVGVWICFADTIVQPVETTSIYQLLKKDLIPETHGAAIDAVGKWLKKFNENFSTTEKEVEEMVKNSERLPFLKNKLLELAEHVSESDGNAHFSEESAIYKLKNWVG